MSLILQGSVVTQTLLGRLTIGLYLPVANFLQCICAKNYETWWRVDKVIAIKQSGSLFGPPCIRQNINPQVAILLYARLLRMRAKSPHADASVVKNLSVILKSVHLVTNNSTKILGNWKHVSGKRGTRIHVWETANVRVIHHDRLI